MKKVEISKPLAGGSLVGKVHGIRAMEVGIQKGCM